MVGPLPVWSDTEYLLARACDSLAHLGFMYQGVHAKNPSKRPPDPVTRPDDPRAVASIPATSTTVGDVTVTINQQKRETVIMASLSIEELQAAVEEQTGSPRGIASGVD